MTPENKKLHDDIMMVADQCKDTHPYVNLILRAAAISMYVQMEMELSIHISIWMRAMKDLSDQHLTKRN